MKRYILAGLLAAFAHPAMADIERPWDIGGALSSMVIGNDLPMFDDDRFSGFSMYLNYTVNRNVAFRGSFTAQSHDDVSIRSRVTEVAALLGGGFGREGWKGYVGPTLFRDNWSASGISETFTGMGLLIGGGYTWDEFAVDLFWTIRDSSDYEDFFESALGVPVDVDVTAFSFGISLRF